MDPEARILLIEDDPVTQNMMKSLLEKDGFGVEVVGEGIECISTIENDLPDIILLDILLPDVSGLFVVTAIREKYTARRVARHHRIGEGQFRSSRRRPQGGCQ